jgi:CDP-glycerol glycerophosphotransferase
MSTPRLSVILVVYRDQAYLRDCVSSILDQSFDDFELLAVDNASPDHAPDLLEELATADSRLIVRHLQRPKSLGEARNLALDSAVGESVWFVEATDLLPAGALATVVSRLDEIDPDVLVVASTRRASLGGPRPGPHRRTIRALRGVATFTLDDHPVAAGLAIGLWDKIFRREFIGRLDARFAAGRYGELTLTYPALLAADRIGVLDRVCYSRLEAANAADEPQTHGTPFDVFSQYDRVFRFADRRSASRRRLLLRHMLGHHLSILSELPEDRREEFFACMSDSHRRHTREDDLRPKSRGLRMQLHLVERRRYGSFRALGWAAEQRDLARGQLNKVRRRRRKLTSWRRRKALERYYRSQLTKPIEPDLAVFAAYWYRSYSCNPRAIYEKLREVAPWVRGVWVVDKAYARNIPDDVEHVLSGTREYYRVIARAKYFVNNVNFPNEFVKREGTIHVQTHHGSPVKKMGLDLRDALFMGSRMDFEALLRRCARWDYSITSNVFSTLMWERAYPTRYQTLEVGYPRNDVLVNSTEADVTAIREQLGIEPGRRAVLYAPTHREYLSGYLPTLDLNRAADGLGPEYVIMPRVHYFYDGDEQVEDLNQSGRILDVTRHPSIEELLLAADVLVTDYSSMLFDYAVLDRPIVVHAPDWEVYRALRGTYFDLLAEPPGVVTRTDHELVTAFRSGAVWGEEAARQRAAFRSRFCTHDDGHAAERVVTTVWLSGRELKTPALENSDRTSWAGIEA